ncbi:MAG TPA: RCC1 domain-containing protein [Oligoflexus sp.]|uniref:RCC1 domain-containing protein n=1 Tax=Oligoflexus sp. TaxID=1971216 RepID=UPI002D7039CF|nr:RCC1 domain-containing protein [Oligoflexus sp.]HYX37434.1 RCC1 domain-containing protein [Oligoflexus sp.]
MHARLILLPLTSLIFSLSVTTGCTLSNRVEDIKVLCGLKVVNPDIEYVRLLSPGLAPLAEQDRARTSAEFIHTDGRIEALTLSPAGCLALPKADGQLSARVSSDQEWVAFENGLKADRSIEQRDLVLAERGRLNVQWPCPDQGFLANESLAPMLAIRDSVGNLQNLQLQLTVSDKNGKNLGTLFSKDFGNKALELPTRLPLTALSEGEFTVSMSLTDSFFGQNEKALLVASQCPLQVKRSCASPNDSFDSENLSCKPKLCDNKYRVGEFWSEELSNKKGNGLFTCQLQAGEPVRLASDATCEAGYFESRASCIGATQVAAGLNHSCAVLENGDVSCWGYNVFDTLGPSDSVGSSGKALGPQPPLSLSEPAQYVGVSSVSSCALLTSGRVQCWGSLPKTIDSEGFVQYEVSGHPQFVRMADGSELQQVKSLTVGGGPDQDTYCVVTQKKEALCWGKDLLSRRQTLQFGNWLYPQRIFADRTIQQLAVSDREICGLDSEGSVFCQGSALGSDLFAIALENPAVLVPVALPAPARWISSQSIGKCALLVDDRLFCWGLKTNKMQNLEWNFAHGVPDIPRAMTLPEENKNFFQQVKEVGLNGEISCVLKADSQPVCQLGTNAYESETVNGVYINTRPPRLQARDILKEDGTALRDIQTLAVGFWHGCGVHVSGQVYCWGNNQFGRLGNGTMGESGTGTGIPRIIRASLIQAP